MLCGTAFAYVCLLLSSFRFCYIYYSLLSSPCLISALVDYETFTATNKMLATDAATLKHVPIRVCSPNLRTVQDLVNPKDEKGIKKSEQERRKKKEGDWE